MFSPTAEKLRQELVQESRYDDHTRYEPAGVIVAEDVWGRIQEELETPAEWEGSLGGFDVHARRTWPKGYVGLLDEGGRLLHVFRFEAP